MEEQTETGIRKNYTGLIVLGILVALIAIAAAVLSYHFLYAKPLLQENEELKELVRSSYEIVKLKYKKHG